MFGHCEFCILRLLLHPSSPAVPPRQGWPARLPVPLGNAEGRGVAMAFMAARRGRGLKAAGTGRRENNSKQILFTCISAPFIIIQHGLCDGMKRLGEITCPIPQ